MIARQLCRNTAPPFNSCPLMEGSRVSCSPSFQAQEMPNSEALNWEDAPKVGGVIRRPIPIFKPDPAYPERARLSRLSGTLKMWVVVDGEGNVINTTITNPLGLGLDAVALETVRTWKFQPATRYGTPVTVKVEVVVSFRQF